MSLKDLNEECKTPEIQKAHLTALKALEGCPSDLEKKCPAYIRALYYHVVEWKEEMKSSLEKAEKDQKKFTPWYSECPPDLKPILDGTDPIRWLTLRTILRGGKHEPAHRWFITTTEILNYMKTALKEREVRNSLIATIREKFGDFVEPQPLECQYTEFILRVHELLNVAPIERKPPAKIWWLAGYEAFADS